MKDLKILNLYNNSSDNQVESFSNSLNSSMEVVHNFDEYIYDSEWIDKMEEAIRYIDNILRNPNRFIINEEEVVKIELARRITVESIKHLSKNTNFIQDINEKTGDVKPSKILNINKEESYNTYENRFVYSLIKNMIMYINKKKQGLAKEFFSKNDKRITYSGGAKFGSEEVSIALDLRAKSDGGNPENSLESILGRIKELENQIADLTRSDLYTTIEKTHVSLVTSPIKKTNMILKNTNFQYALNLWNFMQSHMDDSSKTNKGNKVIKDDPILKEMMDEAFMINYLVSDIVGKENVDLEKKKVVTEKIVTNLVQKIVATNNEITKKELTDMVDKEFSLIQNQDLSDSQEIKKVFKLAIKDYYNDTKDISFKKLEKEDKNVEDIMEDN